MGQIPHFFTSEASARSSGAWLLCWGVFPRLVPGSLHAAEWHPGQGAPRAEALLATPPRQVAQGEGKELLGAWLEKYGQERGWRRKSAKELEELREPEL